MRCVGVLLSFRLFITSFWVKKVYSEVLAILGTDVVDSPVLLRLIVNHPLSEVGSIVKFWSGTDHFTICLRIQYSVLKVFSKQIFFNK